MAKFNNIANNFRGLIKSGEIKSSGVKVSPDPNLLPGTIKAKSFEQRQNIEKNRTHVGAYRDSKVINDYRQSSRSEDTRHLLHSLKKSRDSIEDNEYIPLSNRQKAKFTDKLKNQRQAMNARFGGKPTGKPVAPSYKFSEPKSRYK